MSDGAKAMMAALIAEEMKSGLRSLAHSENCHCRLCKLKKQDAKTFQHRNSR